ncbi:BTAD domain-containing putative transcriptional regulator [Streptomyces hygroscopicus]|uniref:BTAD domain-containing putative transcriptional regulator n=1 Tax=Streptomyces hygroscopicus TaxID=1912 RepID=UPI003677CF6C
MRPAATVGELRFHVLGPLEVLRNGVPLPLGGIKQRTVLGYLLLHPNRVTATSRLISALWDGPSPASARKMVQNAVWRLRKLLHLDEEHAEPEDMSLQSRPPGYLLRVDPQAVDLYRFHELVAQGRARMRDGGVAEASRLWRQALALWRGPLLADLAEAGVAWPELKVSADTRLDVLEEYFDAELALGRHNAVLPELLTLRRAEPRRERLTGQLMLSLHRSGRQSDALDVYRAHRAELADQLGLDPSRELQELHQAILTHDTALHYTPLPGTVQARPAPRQPSAAAGAASPAPDAVEESAGLVPERKEVSVALINAVCPAVPGGGDPEQVDAAMEALHEVVVAEANRFDGIVAAKLGCCWLVVFGAGRSHDNDAMRAVLTVLAVRHRIRARNAHPLHLRAAVDTGEALVRYGRDGAGPPTVTSAALDRPQSLLPLVPLDEVWVSEGTRGQTDNLIGYQRARVHAAMWTVQGVRCATVRGPRLPLLGRADCVRALTDLLDTDAVERRVALVVGGPGMGKSAVLEEFERQTAGRDPATRPLLAHLLPCTVDDSALRVVAAELSSCCGIGSWDPPGTARAKLWAMVERAAADADEARRLFERLLVPLGQVTHQEQAAGPEEVVAAWCTLLERLAAERTVVVVIDDLHAADESVLGLVGPLLGQEGPARLKVVAAARPELFLRRPAWESAVHVTAELTRLPDTVVAELTRTVLEADGVRDRPPGPVAELVEVVTALADGNPMFAAELARMALRRVGPDPAAADAAPDERPEAAHAMLPSAVGRALAAQLDALPADLKAVAQDAAVLGEAVRPEDVAALRDQRPSDADDVADALGELVRRGVLMAAPADAGNTGSFTFRQPLLREVAYARLPQARRAAKHAAVARWEGRSRAPGGSLRPVASELLRLGSVVQRLRDAARTGPGPEPGAGLTEGAPLYPAGAGR